MHANAIIISEKKLRIKWAILRFQQQFLCKKFFHQSNKSVYVFLFFFFEGRVEENDKFATFSLQNHFFLVLKSIKAANWKKTKILLKYKYSEYIQAFLQKWQMTKHWQESTCFFLVLADLLLFVFFTSFLKLSTHSL